MFFYYNYSMLFYNQVATVTWNQLPGQLVSAQISPQVYKFIIALTMLNISFDYINNSVLLCTLAFIAGAEPILRFHQPLITKAYTYIACMLTKPLTPCTQTNMNWKPYALTEYVHGF